MRHLLSGRAGVRRLGIVACIWLLPVASLVAYSLQDRSHQAAAWGIASWSGDNYLSFGQLVPTGERLVASAVLSLLVTVSGLLMAVPLAFSLARLSAPYAWLLLGLLLAARSVPTAAVSYSLFLLLRRAGIGPGLLPTVLILVIHHAPIAVAVIFASARQVTREVLWSAEMDGLRQREASLVVGWRLIVPAAAVAAILMFTAAWNDYWVVQTFSSTKWRTLSADLPSLVSQGMIRWGEIAAGGVIDCIPDIAAAAILARFLMALGGRDGAGRRE